MDYMVLYEQIVAYVPWMQLDRVECYGGKLVAFRRNCIDFQ